MTAATSGSLSSRLMSRAPSEDQSGKHLLRSLLLALVLVFRHAPSGFREGRRWSSHLSRRAVISLSNSYCSHRALDNSVKVKIEAARSIDTLRALSASPGTRPRHRECWLRT